MKKIEEMDVESGARFLIECAKILGWGILAVLLVAGTIWAGEKETAALKVITLQQEIDVIQEQFKAKQADYQKESQAFKKETDQNKKGEIAVRMLKLEEDLIKMNESVQQKGREIGESRAKFRELVK
jgi:outer membrane murein-binding lipoprotein Lpp